MAIDGTILSSSIMLFFWIRSLISLINLRSYLIYSRKSLICLLGCSIWDSNSFRLLCIWLKISIKILICFHFVHVRSKNICIMWLSTYRISSSLKRLNSRICSYSNGSLPFILTQNFENCKIKKKFKGTTNTQFNLIIIIKKIVFVYDSAVICPKATHTLIWQFTSTTSQHSAFSAFIYSRHQFESIDI